MAVSVNTMNLSNDLNAIVSVQINQRRIFADIKARQLIISTAQNFQRLIFAYIKAC